MVSGSLLSTAKPQPQQTTKPSGNTGTTQQPSGGDSQPSGGGSSQPSGGGQPSGDNSGIIVDGGGAPAHAEESIDWGTDWGLGGLQ